MTQKDKDNFELQYLYIEEVPLSYIEESYKKEKENKKSDESYRGYVVISLFNEEE